MPSLFATLISSLQTLREALEIALMIDDPVSFDCSKKIVNGNPNDQMQDADSFSGPGLAPNGSRNRKMCEQKGLGEAYVNFNTKSGCEKELSRIEVGNT